MFVVACKDAKPADPSAKETPTPTESSPQARPRPTLPGAGAPGAEDGRDRPRLPGEADSDRERRRDMDPAEREEMRANREERRKQRDEMLDTNKDGVVSDAERQQRMEPMRKRLDANSDGKLTPDELGASDRRMAFEDPAAVDTNKDGEISLAELDVAVAARREKMRARWRGRGGRGSADVGPD